MSNLSMNTHYSQILINLSVEDIELKEQEKMISEFRDSLDNSIQEIIKNPRYSSIKNIQVKVN